jgi:cellulose synthase/poly-beta-1,6-N-acetylglucosamine synthase-like glycosyltransferase
MSDLDSTPYETVHDAEAPEVSMLVPAWNESDNIEPFVQSFLALSYPAKQLVLCAGGADDTYARAAAWSAANIIVIPQLPGDGKQRALRKCFEHATGSIILLTDADCLLNQDSLERLIDPIRRGDTEVTTGVSIPKAAQLSHPLVYYQYAVQDRWAPVVERKKTVKALLGRNCALSRAVLEDVGAFDDDVAIGTDSFLAKKLVARGHAIQFVADSIVETEFPTSIAGYFRQRSRWRRNAITHNFRFRHYRRVLTAFKAPVRGLAMLLVPALGLRFGRRILAIWAIAVVYAWFTRVRYVRSITKPGMTASPSVYVRLLPYLFVEWATQGAALIQLLIPRAKRQW